MPSLITSALIGLAGVGLTSYMVPKFKSGWTQQIPLSMPVNLASACSGGTVSCTNTTVVSNLCCFEAPGGLLLQTQFWDSSPSSGPSDSWTIHGLWPDHCDLTFSENCDPSRAYTNIGGLLSEQGAQATLEYMQTYWVDIDGKDETFWEHEWKTHGTCMSTLEPKCLPQGSPKGAEAVAFFNTVVKLFQTLPTYTWLANQGITPSSSASHTLSSLNSALQTESGFLPALDCEGKTLNSISWYFYLKGSVADGTFVQIDPPEDGNCPSSGILYPPKTDDEDAKGSKPKKTPSRHEARLDKAN
ncbi:ribonuclease T2-like protein [Mycena rosella]|uniref:ribonuclease T2 n=1 Tax=Mycena rosella TaxID=1033263 RepID=A0AAD7GWK5_MYCRO|nr:ribonuclease T2-like protein [Mycena rosella]